MSNLDLAPIGNCTVSALIDQTGRYVWACAPRVDKDPVFCALLRGDEAGAAGQWSIDLEDCESHSQYYRRNTAILVTRLRDRRGGEIEIADFCPRFYQNNRTYRPIAFARIVTPISGAPRIRVNLTPTANWGARLAEHTSGSNHIRYLCSDMTMRLTTSAPVTHILHQRFFRLESEHVFFLGPDEPFNGDLRAVVRGMLDNTDLYWRAWVRNLATPLDWQEAVIRAAIALKLCVYEETGAIVAALTTSIPEAPGTERTWDYRFCWLRDAYYTVQALNRLGAAEILEGYLAYLRNIVDSVSSGLIQPVYGVGLEPALDERFAGALAGYRGMGPVRVGNEAHNQNQHDVYGQIVLSNTQAFFDSRLFRPSNAEDFMALERVGDRAFASYLKPDAGLWEFRTRNAVHTYSSVMCWAACDRLAKAAEKLMLRDRAEYWRGRATSMRDTIESHAWRSSVGRFSATLHGDELDASLLQLVDMRFIGADDPRFLATLDAVERGLRRGPHMMRYVDEDDFGRPRTAFNFCTFWLIEALFRVGRKEEARSLFEDVLTRRTAAGLLSEDCDIETGEPWGNYPQTYSLAGLINCAVLLSNPWSNVR